MIIYLFKLKMNLRKIENITQEITINSTDLNIIMYETINCNENMNNNINE